MSTTEKKRVRPLHPVTPDVSFPDLEEEVLDFWDDRDVFRKSLALRKEPAFVFYDGPPFATGLPHYGHLLAGTIKDIIPRYWTMRGYYVERRFGWDCHGLPVEYEVENELDVHGKKQIETFGVDKFNEACRSVVLRYTQEWRRIVKRAGRWVDFDNGYRTMDKDYMESIWWVFKQLWDEGLIYEGHKVLPYSTAACTPLSNFESKLNYHNVQDPSITVRFEATGETPVDTEKKVYYLAWTTTPWTLPGNLALSVGTDIDYVTVSHPDGNLYVLARSRLEEIFRDEADALEVIAEHTGKELAGLRYEPLLPYFADRREEGAFRIILADFVTTEDGTGIVHTAPAYGEVDFFACQEVEPPIRVADAVDAEGCFTEEVADYEGLHVKAADKEIIRRLKDEGKILRHETVDHEYPYCWRTDTPLIYKAISTWFVNVESIKDRLVANNEETHWVPDHLRDGRFGNWLRDARDWAISRNRYWGTPIPIWRCSACDAERAIGSVSTLEELSGETIDDLHKHYVDDVTFPCAECGESMSRIEEVLDCWFESGAMPYAQSHYPFERKEWFEANFPADFIAEGLDQTRGWFYTLMVLSTALFDKPAFKNVIVNGIILAADGKKMSKKLKNYPPPEEVCDEIGADAMRIYLIDSPLVQAESLKFSKDGTMEVDGKRVHVDGSGGVKGVVRRVLLPIWNAYNFFVTYARADDWSPSEIPADRSPNILDNWILSRLNTLLERINEEMEAYRLYKVVPPLLAFIEELTNWYIRMNRRRFWSDDDPEDKRYAYATLYQVLTTLCRMLAPFMPFVTETIYQNLVVTQDPGAPESVHLTSYPEADESYFNRRLENAVSYLEEAILLGRSLRNDVRLKIRQPLKKSTLVLADADVGESLKPLVGYVASELNVKEVEISYDEDSVVSLTARPDMASLGPRIGGTYGGRVLGQVKKAVENLSPKEIRALEAGEDLPPMEIEGHEIQLTLEDVVISRIPRPDVTVSCGEKLSILFDTEITPELKAEGLSREFVNRVQKLRKEADFDVSDRIAIRYETDETTLAEAIEAHRDYIMGETLATRMTFGPPEGPHSREAEIEDIPIRIGVARTGAAPEGQQAS